MDTRKMREYVWHLKEIIRLGKELGGSPQMIANDIICIASESPDVTVKEEFRELLDNRRPASGHRDRPTEAQRA